MLTLGPYNSSPVFPARHDFAQTNLQLFNQLADAATAAELEQLTAAYDLARELFGNRFRGSGRTFLAHLVGVASIVAAQGESVDLVAAALLHAAYQDGQFDDGVGGATETHRARVRNAVGAQVEAYIYGYNELAWRRTGTIPKLLKTAGTASPTTQALMRMRLANELEEYLDLGILYYPNFAELALVGEIYGATLVELAQTLGCDELAVLLGKAFDSVSRFTDAPAEEPRAQRTERIQLTQIDLDHCLAWNFAQQAARHAEKVAVKGIQANLTDTNLTATTLTYAELQRQSDQLAQALVETLGADPVPVATLFAHDARQVVAALGVWKANKIWVPLDSMHPEPRLKQIVEDSTAPLLLHAADLSELAQSIDSNTRRLLSVDAISVAAASERKLPTAKAEDPACIIYTSGSTGTPKGVVHSHRSLSHLARRSITALHITAEDRLTLVPSCTQVAGVTDLLRALLSGATLMPFDVRGGSMRKLRDWLYAEAPTVFHCSATLLRTFAETLDHEDRFSSVRLVHLGGEAVTRGDVATFRTHFPREALLLNNLGCSEMSGYRQFFVDQSFENDQALVPAGYPVADIELSVCDSSGTVLATGEIGEVVLQSAYLASGYWRRPAETDAVFESVPGHTALRRYRTGDQGYLMEDGCLMFSGREDSQLKVRGQRVELAEIEATLSGHPDLDRVAVAAGPSREKPLIAYVQPTEGEKPDVRELRRFLQVKLPAYMTPEFIVLDALPLTVNDKVDHARLQPAAVDESAGVATLSPRAPRFMSATEKTLAALWEGCLQQTVAVQPEDNFFELGGDSLLVIRLVNQIETELDATISLREVFSCDSLSDLASLVVARRIQARVDVSGESERLAVESLLSEIETMPEDAVLQELSREMPFSTAE